jgi:cytochrome c oxidase assembly protein subunit 11
MVSRGGRTGVRLLSENGMWVVVGCDGARAWRRAWATEVCAGGGHRGRSNESFARALARERGIRVEEGGSKAQGAGGESRSERNRRYALYIASVGVAFLGASYGAVPLYQAFCRATGYGGTTQKADADEEKFRKVRPVPGARPVTVHFTATTSESLPWKFVPLQDSVRVVPGETALVFYRARNLSKKPIVGVSTYNVVPFAVGAHFEKIQCFCFEYQRLLPNEEVDMPIFFYIDPEFASDPSMAGTRDVTLSYTFFRCEDEEKAPEIRDQAQVDAWTQAMSARVGMPASSDTLTAPGDAPSAPRA